MRADKERQPGFYWVRFEGKEIVAEWVKRRSPPYISTNCWLITGSKMAFKDREVCELLSARLGLSESKGTGA